MSSTSRRSSGPKAKPIRNRLHWNEGVFSNTPTKYQPDYCAMMVEFAKRPENSLVAFAAAIGVGRQTLNHWAEKHADFRRALDQAKTVNEAAMFRLGVRGMKGFNGSGAWQGAWSFTMSARFGWRSDRSEDDGEQDLTWED